MCVCVCVPFVDFGRCIVGMREFFVAACAGFVGLCRCLVVLCRCFFWFECVICVLVHLFCLFVCVGALLVCRSFVGVYVLC